MMFKEQQRLRKELMATFHCPEIVKKRTFVGYCSLSSGFMVVMDPTDISEELSSDLIGDEVERLEEEKLGTFICLEDGSYGTTNIKTDGPFPIYVEIEGDEENRKSRIVVELQDPIQQ